MVRNLTQQVSLFQLRTRKLNSLILNLNFFLLLQFSVNLDLANIVTSDSTGMISSRNFHQPRYRSQLSSSTIFNFTRSFNFLTSEARQSKDAQKYHHKTTRAREREENEKLKMA